MASTNKKKNSVTGSDNRKDKITRAYIDHMLTKGTRPASVYEFTSKLNIEEQEFYANFNSFEGLEKSIWAGFIQSTLEILAASDEYASYPLGQTDHYFSDVVGNRGFGAI